MIWQPNGSATYHCCVEPCGERHICMQFPQPFSFLISLCNHEAATHAVHLECKQAWNESPPLYHTAASEAGGQAGRSAALYWRREDPLICSRERRNSTTHMLKGGHETERSDSERKREREDDREGEEEIERGRVGREKLMKRERKRKGEIHIPQHSWCWGPCT